MMWKVFSVYDSKVEAYLRPFFMRSRGEAIRGFVTVVNEAGTDFNKYPEDYTLFEIGDYDEKTGVISPSAAKTALGVAVEFLKAGPAVPDSGPGKVLPLNN